MKIILSEEEKEEIREYIDPLETAYTAFNVASGFIKEARKDLFKKLENMFGVKVKTMNHPEKGDWVILTLEENEEGENNAE